MSARVNSTRKRVNSGSTRVNGEHQIEGGRPKKPTVLSEAADAYWNYWVNTLAANNVLTVHHGRAVMEICEASALIDRLRADVAERGPTLASKNVKGSTFVRAHPATALLLAAQKQLFQMLNAFGLTPRSVGEVEQVEAKKPKAEARRRYDY